MEDRKSPTRDSGDARVAAEVAAWKAGRSARWRRHARVWIVRASAVGIVAAVLLGALGHAIQIASVSLPAGAVNAAAPRQR
jgi:hypothetical protein